MNPQNIAMQRALGGQPMTGGGPIMANGGQPMQPMPQPQPMPVQGTAMRPPMPAGGGFDPRFSGGAPMPGGGPIMAGSGTPWRPGQMPNPGTPQPAQLLQNPNVRNFMAQRAGLSF